MTHKEAAELHLAAAEGKKWQYKHCWYKQTRAWQNPDCYDAISLSNCICSKYEIRIAPEPKWRPYKDESEFPKEGFFREKDNQERIYTFRCIKDYSLIYIFNKFEYTTDPVRDEWTPAGVKESE